ncbi:uncharacterized protein LOC115450776 [Manduca sexta]|uniref:Uncharacterized protein n=1 Tax=Manduca sexta TaxID=7130 RepID=A0A921ZPV3_MANSE|nr:uncharacterized protein LOC115450776 [Manduca sexta]XP_030034746.1 uncharacterized protein LOC115450776 [Manduca sexta]KAG6461186.1 hypothetical protein O3G_MSEX012471 [Manduca sexta]
MDYNQIKKIDEESLQQLTEGSGPSDKCICGLLSNQEDQGIKASIKRALSSFKQGKKERNIKGNSVVIPLSSLGKGGRGQKSIKEVVKRKTSCGKCGCDDENIVLKHSYANIRITTPDVSSFCPCPSSCLPDREKFQNNIKVTIERVQILDVDSTDSEFNLYQDKDDEVVKEPPIERRSISSLIDAQFTKD